MAFVEGQTIRGWGVFRPDPWHFDSIHPTRAVARARAKVLGQGYKVQRGENQAGTSNFIYGDTDPVATTFLGQPGNLYAASEEGRKSRRIVQRQLALGDRPLTFGGRPLVVSLPEDIDETSRPPDSLGALTGAAFAGGSFAGDAFATDDANGDDGIYSIDEPLPDISDFDFEDDDDEDELGEDENLGGTEVPVVFRGEPVTYQGRPVTIRVADSSPRQSDNELPRGPFSYLTDSDGSILTDENGSALVEQFEKDLNHRTEVERNLSLLDKAVEDLRYLAINRSHNQPPELVDEIPVSSKVIDELKASIEEVKTEVRAMAPNIANLQRQSSMFQMVLDGCKSIPGQLVIGGVLTTIVTDSLKGDFVILGTLQTALANTIHALGGWLQYLQGLGLN